MGRLRWAILAVLAAVAAVAAWWICPPSIVRNLPPGETLVYINYSPMRAMAPTRLAPAVRRAPGYAAFVRESGFDFERDLDSVALSLDGNPARPAAATAILRGRFSPAFTAYLRQHALEYESVAGVDAFVFPGWARPQQRLTVARLGNSELLVTNAADAAAVIGTRGAGGRPRQHYGARETTGACWRATWT